MFSVVFQLILISETESFTMCQSFREFVPSTKKVSKFGEIFQQICPNPSSSAPETVQRSALQLKAAAGTDTTTLPEKSPSRRSFLNSVGASVIFSSTFNKESYAAETSQDADIGSYLFPVSGVEAPTDATSRWIWCVTMAQIIV